MSFLCSSRFWTRKHSKGCLPKAAHDFICSLQGNSLIVQYSASVAPFTIECRFIPGDNVSISLMYLHAVRGFFQNALYMMADSELSARARAMPPPGEKGIHGELWLLPCFLCLLFLIQGHLRS